MYEILKKFSQHIITDNLSIKNAMEKIDSLGISSTNTRNYKFLILVDKNKKLLGTITDGDIRRSIIAGKNLDSEVINSANLNPRYGLINQELKNKNILKSLLYDTYFLPIINENREVVNVLVANEIAHHKKVSVILMAGGFGKRLGEKTLNTPKPLIKKDGKPLINYVLDRISKSNNISKVYVSTHYLSNKIKDHINKLNFKLPVEILYEEKPLGTAGIISIIDKKKIKEDLLVVNADLITNLDFDNLINYHNSSVNDITIAVAKYIFNVPYGVIEYNSQGIFKRIIEKPDISKYVSAGIYILSQNIKEVLTNKIRIDMPELINKGIEAGLSVGVFPIHENWSDIGRPEDL